MSRDLRSIPGMPLRQIHRGGFLSPGLFPCLPHKKKTFRFLCGTTCQENHPLPDVLYRTRHRGLSASWKQQVMCLLYYKSCPRAASADGHNPGFRCWIGCALLCAANSGLSEVRLPLQKGRSSTTCNHPVLIVKYTTYCFASKPLTDPRVSPILTAPGP